MEGSVLFEERYEIARKPLWNPTGLLTLSIVFTPMISMIFYIINYHRMGDEVRRNRAIIGYIIVCISILTGVFVLSGIFPKLVLAINVGIGGVMKQTQESHFREYVNRGGQPASFIMPIILSILIVGLFVYVKFFTGDIPDQKTEFFNDEIFYTQGVSATQVDQLGKYLQTIGIISNDQKEISVKLDSTANTYLVSFIMDEKHIYDQDVFMEFSDLKRALEKDVFVGKKVVIVFANDTFKELRRIGE